MSTREMMGPSLAEMQTARDFPREMSAAMEEHGAEVAAMAESLDLDSDDTRDCTGPADAQTTQSNRGPQPGEDPSRADGSADTPEQPKTASAFHCVAVVARCDCGATTVQQDGKVVAAALNGAAFTYECGKCHAKVVSRPQIGWTPPQPRMMPNRAQRRAQAAKRGRIILPGGG